MASVRQVQAVSDPFHDPFGDRSVTRQAADLELLPAENAEADDAPRIAAKPTYEILPAPSPLRNIPSRGPATLEPTLVAQPPSEALPPSGIADSRVAATVARIARSQPGLAVRPEIQ